MMRFRKAKLWLFALSILMASCALIPERPSAPALHDLGPATRAELQDPPVRWSVEGVDAPEWLRNDQIRYRLLYADPTRVGFYTLDRWIAPPPTLLAQQLGMAGDGGGYRLRIRLQEFEQMFDRPGQARVVMRFLVAAREPGSLRIVGERAFRINRASPGANAAGAVRGFSALVEEAIARLRAWLAGLPAPSG
jgi:cholesterol transport system auxiliary component